MSDAARAASLTSLQVAIVHLPEPGASPGPVRDVVPLQNPQLAVPGTGSAGVATSVLPRYVPHGPGATDAIWNATPKGPGVGHNVPRAGAL